MRSIKGSFVIACSFVLFSVASLRANPNPPGAYLVLSEVQITDSAHWAIEVLFKNFFQKTALTADSLTDQFSLVYKNVPSALRPKVKVSSNGYAVITPQNYDSLLTKPRLSPMEPISLYFHPGDTVKLHYDYERAGNPGDTLPPGDTVGIIWQCIIDKDIKPTQSMVAFQEAVMINGYNFGDYIMWCKSDSPTIGSANTMAGTYGAIKGFVCDKDSQPLTNVPVSYVCCSYCGGSMPQCSMKTDTSGCFIVPSLVSTDHKTFSFPGMSSDSFGPFSTEPDCTLKVVCKLDDYVATSTHNSVLSSPATSLKIVGITKSKSDVLIVFDGGNSPGDYDVEVFSLSGKQVYASTVSGQGSGTYSVNWKPGIHAGIYVARIRSQSASAEQRFTIK